MATSTFYREASIKKRNLLEQLVERMHAGKSGAEKRAMVEVTEQKLQFHSFLDTDPSEVERRWGDVLELLQVESRGRTCTRLKRLKEQFLATSIQSDVLEIHHGILRFLLCMMGNVSTVVDRSAAAYEMEVDSVISDESSQLTEDDAWCSEKNESPSELSEWTDDEALEDVTPQKIDEENDSFGVTCPNWQAYFCPDRKDDPVPASKQDRRSGESLLQCLAKIQLPEIPLGACPLLVRSESELVRSCLRAMQGRDSSIFVWDRLQKCFSVDSRVQTEHFSAVAMRKALMWFGQSGSHVRLMLESTSVIVEANSQRDLGRLYSRPLLEQNRVCPTLSAAAQAISEQLHDVLYPIIQLEHHLATQTGSTISLIHLKCLCVPICQRVHALHTIQESLDALQKEGMVRSELTKQILDTLYDSVTSDYALGGPSDEACVELKWNVFVASLVPLLSQLTAWLYLGDLSALSDDFFISPKAAQDSEDSDFWMDSYPLTEGACPKFLHVVASVVHDGGKALQFMKSQEYGPQFEDYAVSSSRNVKAAQMLVDDNWTGDLLYKKFTSHLSLVRQGQNPQSRHRGSACIAERMAAAGEYRADRMEIVRFMGQPVPWTYISEEEPVLDANLMNMKPLSAAILPENTATEPEIVPTVPEVEMEDRSALPKMYVDVLTAMEKLRTELDTALNGDAVSSKSALELVLPGPTERSSYSDLREIIFGSSVSASELSVEKEPAIHRQKSPIQCLPVEVLLEEGLLNVLICRSSKIVHVFIDCLLKDLGLMEEILVLKNVFLLGSPAMVEWVRRLCEKLIAGQELNDLKEFDLITDMQECFRRCHAGESLPVCGHDEFEDLFFDMRVAEWAPLLPEQHLWQERSPEELKECALMYPLKWPLCLAVNEPRLRRYNTIFLFLLKLQWVTRAVEHNISCLKNTQHRLPESLFVQFPNLQNWRRLHLISREMLHFIGHLQRHVLQNSHQVFDQFCQAITTAESIGELLRSHDEALDAIARISFQSRKKQWKTVHARVLTLLHVVLNFCVVWEAIAATDQRDRTRIDGLLQCLDGLVDRYIDARSSVTMIVQLYGCSLGGDSELNRLVALVNFNDFYPNCL